MVESGGESYFGKLDELPLINDPNLRKGMSKRIAFGPGRFMEDRVMRYFTFEPSVAAPLHNHDWPHNILILEGEAKATISGEVYDLPAGSWAYVPPNVEHFLENGSDQEMLKFVCIVPIEGDPFLTPEEAN